MPESSSSQAVLLLCVVVGGVLALFLALTFLFFRKYRRRRQKNGSSHSDEGDEYPYDKQDAWLKCMSTPAAYRFMNDPKSKEKIRVVPMDAVHIHLIVLVHGWFGRPCSLGYTRDALEQQIAQATSTGTIKGGNNGHHSLSPPSCCFIIHAATANQGKTSDGVAAGGSRLAQEVNEIIRNIQDQVQHQQQQEEEEGTGDHQGKQRILSLSFVGFSLGGLYARYALSEIDSIQQNDEASKEINAASEGRNRGLMIVVVRPAIFCTACSPHLGLANELSYIPWLPRCLQYFMANAMQQTGRDLFRCHNSTSLLQDMIMKPRFRDVLVSFQQRITYVNTYATDFQVPTQTAAFLADNIDTIHQRVVVTENVEADDISSTTGKLLAWGMIALIVETASTYQRQQQGTNGGSRQLDDDDDSSSSAQESSLSKKTTALATAELSKEMDALGWTKVFCDVRQELNYSVPRCCLKRCCCCTSSSSSCPNNNTRPQQPCSNRVQGDIEEPNDDNPSPCVAGGESEAADERQRQQPHTRWNEKTCYSSSELLARYNFCSKDRLYLPTGHLVLVAETKTVGQIEATARGRPIVDELASRIVHGIVQQQQQEQCDGLRTYT